MYVDDIIKGNTHSHFKCETFLIFKWDNLKRIKSKERNYYYRLTYDVRILELGLAKFTENK